MNEYQKRIEEIRKRAELDLDDVYNDIIKKYCTVKIGHVESYVIGSYFLVERIRVVILDASYLKFFVEGYKCTKTGRIYKKANLISKTIKGYL